jgi:hypothetical protein
VVAVVVLLAGTVAAFVASSLVKSVWPLAFGSPAFAACLERRKHWHLFMSSFVRTADTTAHALLMQP